MKSKAGLFIIACGLGLTVAVSGVAEGAPPTRVVPVPTGNNAVITVKAGGTRTAPNTVSGLAGVILKLYDGVNQPTTPVADTWGTCTSDSDGDCSFVVPETQVGGVNRDRRFWVVQSSWPLGWVRNTPLTTGSSGGLQSTAYQFRTGPQLQSGISYTSSGLGASFMTGTGATDRLASTGLWQSSLVNPVASTKCGQNVALVLDLSDPVADDLNGLKAAAKSVVDSLAGTPSQVALFPFATDSPSNDTNNRNRPLTSVSTQAGAHMVDAWIGSGNNGDPGATGLTSGGERNWDRALYSVASSSDHFDEVVVITHGNPTTSGAPAIGSGLTRFSELENAIFSANSVKYEGAHIQAYGVGSASAINLRAISGSFSNLDYLVVPDYASVASDLTQRVLAGQCSGTVTVVKQVVPSTASPGSIDGATPAGGWSISASAGTTTANPPVGFTTLATGSLNFLLTFPGGTTATTVSLGETQQAGYSLIQQGGANAVCRRLDTGASVPVTNTGATTFTIPVGITDPVSCSVYNLAPPSKVPPSAPRNVHLVPTDSQISVSWLAPDSAGTSPIQSYTATASPGGMTCTTTTLSCDLTGLANQQAYTVSVVARSFDGPSPLGTAGKAVTPKPAAVVVANAAGGRSKLHVDVDPDQGSGFWTFDVQRKQADGSWAVVDSYQTQGDAETRTIDLSAGTYRVVVKAKFGYRGVTSSKVRLTK